MLTQRQTDLLGVITDHMAAHKGVAPSITEMADALGLQRSGIVRMLRELEDRRAIRRLPNKPRAIEVLLSPVAAEREGEALICLGKLITLLDRGGAGTPAWDRAVAWGRQIVAQRNGG